MARFDAELINAIDARIRSKAVRTRDVGTYMGQDDQGYALVQFDGDSLPMPCKYTAGLALVPDTRVTVDLYGSDWTVTESFAKGYWPKYHHDTTLIAGFTNTSGAIALGTPEVGFTFVAPPSGTVLVSVGGYVTQGLTQNSTHLSYSVRTGDNWASGGVVKAFDYKVGIAAGKPVNTSAPAESGATNESPVSGLLPGETYIIRTGHWVSPAGSGSAHARFVKVDQVG